MKLKLLILFLVFSPTTEAGPKHWIATHKRFIAIESAAIGAASIHAAGLHHCRRANGVEPCDAHYGSAWVNFGIVTGMNTVVMPAIAEGCWKDGGGKYCHLFAWTGPAVQAGWGVHEWRINKPDKDREHERRH
jgi:hypothetical protein